MSVPPVTVQIKRKRTDEPVEFLRVQESSGKRQKRAAEFVFSRQPSQTDSTQQAASDAVRRIQQLAESRTSSASSTGTDGGNAAQHTDGGQAAVLAVVPVGNVAKRPNACFNAPQPTRRFHISRNVASVQVQTPKSGTTVQQRPIIFSERRQVKREKVDATTSIPTQHGELSPTTGEEEPARPRKRPGVAARISSGSVLPIIPQYTSAPSRNIQQTSGGWDVNSEKLAADMEAFTLQEIGKNIAAQTEANKPKPRSIASPSRFKPKKPALRYHERHPEEAKPEPDNFDEEMDVDNDDDYIIDTYIRMPANEVEVETEDAIGLLVLDFQQDIDDFYKGQLGEESEEEDIEEDENAENHYSADYPDDEVDSDDEFDRNAHNYYRKDIGNYDDEAFSDDGERYPWANKPWGRKKAGSDDEDDDEISDSEDVYDYTSATITQLSKH